jgi:hypothetical protein
MLADGLEAQDGMGRAHPLGSFGKAAATAA